MKTVFASLMVMLFGGFLAVFATTTPIQAAPPPAAAWSVSGQNSANGITCGFFCPTPTPAPAHAPVIINPSWSNDKLYMDAAASYIQTGAVLLVNRSPYPVQSYALQFDQSGTRFVAGGPNRPGTPGGYLLSNLVPPGIPCTIQVRNPDGMLSNIVNFQH